MEKIAFLSLATLLEGSKKLGKEESVTDKEKHVFLDPEMLLLVFLVNLVGVDTILTRSVTHATKTAAVAVFSTYMAAVGINSLSDENARLISSTIKNGGTAMVDAGVEK